MPFPCPYCNAAVRVTANRRVDCPRCGEAVRVPDDLPLDPDGPLPTAAPDAPRRSNRQIGLTVFGAMLAMAGIALVYALTTIDFRRSNDNKNLDAKARPVAAVPPGELAGLAYLPPDVQAVAGVAVAQALETESGKTLLKSLALTGFTPEEIDHVVLGADIAVLPPRLTIVVRTRKPLDLAKVRAALKAERSEQRQGRTIYSGKLPFRNFDGAMTFPDERTMVAALQPENLDAVPKSPAGGVERFAPPVRDLIARLPNDTPGWLVANNKPDNASLVLVLTLAKVPPDIVQGVQKLRSLSVHAAERTNRLEVVSVATGLDVKQTTALGDAVRDLKAGRWETDGIDPFTVTWSESVAELKQGMTP